MKNTVIAPAATEKVTAETCIAHLIQWFAANGKSEINPTPKQAKEGRKFLLIRKESYTPRFAATGTVTDIHFCVLNWEMSQSKQVWSRKEGKPVMTVPKLEQTCVDRSQWKFTHVSGIEESHRALEKLMGYIESQDFEFYCLR